MRQQYTFSSLREGARVESRANVHLVPVGFVLVVARPGALGALAAGEVRKALSVGALEFRAADALGQASRVRQGLQEERDQCS
jgi:hypothetical protein